MNYYVPCLCSTVSVIPPPPPPATTTTHPPNPPPLPTPCFSLGVFYTCTKRDDESTPTKGKELDLTAPESNTLFWWTRCRYAHMRWREREKECVCVCVCVCVRACVRACLRACMKCVNACSCMCVCTCICSCVSVCVVHYIWDWDVPFIWAVEKCPVFMYIPKYTQLATTDSYKCMCKCKLIFCLHTKPNGVSPGVFALLLHSFLSTFTEQHLWKNSTHSSSIRHPDHTNKILFYFNPKHDFCNDTQFSTVWQATLKCDSNNYNNNHYSRVLDLSNSGLTALYIY